MNLTPAERATVIDAVREVHSANPGVLREGMALIARELRFDPKTGDALPEPLQLVSSRKKANSFENETEVVIACMEARGPGGVCAGEPAGAFRHERLEGQTVFYIVYQYGEFGACYLTRGVK